MKRLNAIEFRLLFLCTLVLSVTGYICYGLVNIHSVPEEVLKSKSEARAKVSVIKSKRGLILDNRNRVLLSNEITGDLTVDKKHLGDPKLAALAVAYQQISTETPNWEELPKSEQESLIRKRRINILKDMQKQDEKDSADKTASLKRMLALFGESSEEATEATKKEVDPVKLEKLMAAYEDYAMSIVSQHVGIDKEYLVNRLRTATYTDPVTNIKKELQVVVLAKNIDSRIMERLRKNLREMRIEGFSFEEKAKRTYFMPRSLVHVMGYTDHEGRGQMGVEKSMEMYLAGQDGSRREQRTVSGLTLPSSWDKLKPPVHGMNIRLTIDMNIQAIVEEELAAALKEYKSERGAVIMIEPKTGDVMAMACLPDFDLNERKVEDLEKGALNYCIQGVYEPGSTFKIAAISGALDAGKVTLNRKFNCGGRTLVDGPVVLNDTAAYGMRSVKEIVTKSSNNGTYLIAKTLYRLPLIEYIKKFGFGSRTGINLSSERPGRVGNGENTVDYSRMAIGYAVGVTPIQVAMAYATIANDGILMRPRLVDKIFDYNNNTVDSIQTEPQIIRRVISSKTAADMRNALNTVTQKGGTGTQALVPGYTVGGKTGTARKYTPGKGYVEGEYTVSFCGMLPAEKPAFICLVVVDNPRNKNVRPFGGTVAAPVFRKIAERVVEVLKIPPNAPITKAA